MWMQDSETGTQLVPSQLAPCNIMGVETGADTVVSLRTGGVPPCAVVPWGWLANGGRPPQRVPGRRRPVHGPSKAAQGTSPTTQLALSLICPLCVAALSPQPAVDMDAKMLRQEARSQAQVRRHMSPVHT